MFRKFLYWLLPLGWMGVIFYSSSTPYENQDIKPMMADWIDLSFLEPYLNGISFTYNNSVVSVEILGVAGFIEFFIRKGAHVTVYFILMCLFYFALKKTSMLTAKNTLILSFILTVAYAVIDEIHQGFTPNRTPYIGDVFLDSFGAAVAVICLLILQGWKHKNGSRVSKRTT